MRHTLLALLLYLGFMNTGMAQLNEFQHVIVPRILQDFNEENKYHTSTLLKHLLTENGFTAYYEGDVPRDIIDKCLGLRIDLLDESTTFRTKVLLVLKDCSSSEVFRTKEGSSRIKSFKEGYEEAIRDAFISIKALNYHYEPRKGPQPTVSLNFDKDVKSVEEPEKMVQTAPEKTTDPAVQQIATPEEQGYQDKKPLPSQVTQANTDTVAPEPADPNNEQSSQDVWYAQEIPTGYQLVDRSPTIRLTIHRSSLPGIYLAESENTHGLVYQQGNRWYFEFYRNNEKVVQELNIKF